MSIYTIPSIRTVPEPTIFAVFNCLQEELTHLQQYKQEKELLLLTHLQQYKQEKELLLLLLIIIYCNV